jgi:hypothetical protein
MTPSRRAPDYPSGRQSSAGSSCPACGKPIARDEKWCPHCGFTGSQTLEIYPDPPPPLAPVLDAANLWNAEETRRIEKAEGHLRRRFPQFRFHVCSVRLPAEASLPVFGFWLLNASPLYVAETPRDRNWAVLWLINAGTGKAAVIPGYSAERWLGDQEWTKAIESMAKDWKTGGTTKAVIRFFDQTTVLLDKAWKVRGDHSRRKSSK